MKTHYKYIHFVEVPNTSGTVTTKWLCYNTKDNDELCEVRWSGAWRQYVTRFTSYHIMSYLEFSKGCHDDISNFLDQLNKTQRGKWKSKDGSK